MPDQPSVVEGVLRRPFAEQVAYFRGKLGDLVPTQRWDDLEREAHDTAFMVAGAQKADLLADLAAAVDRAITEGKSLDAFRKDFDAAVERHDWHGWTGEDTKAGRAWRVRTIYKTNAAVSYAAGRLAQLKDGNYKYWVYFHGGSEDPRPEHLAWNGIALPPDHPFWETHYPPSDWGCSCYVIGARTAAGIRRLGGDPDKKLPDNWNTIDPRTGAPIGIGKGWDYAPGASVTDTVQAFAGKVRQWDYQVAKAFMGEIPEASRDALAAAYRRLPSVADDAGVMRGASSAKAATPSSSRYGRWAASPATRYARSRTLCRGSMPSWGPWISRSRGRISSTSRTHTAIQQPRRRAARSR
ncbi:hypothetical protein JT366_07615 [Sphingomonas paucimobilis]|uniref:phage head morphogenesis protein n=1 Tax=Sphingomonas paucimobilis TaxID=13689 RepID=UPI001963D08E|nr:phage minor head protein [Sphingomonas paucimobilis]QRY97093.1 hypothetical protein JT366_07615 [Sphingomonas paucimobilis]